MTNLKKLQTYLKIHKLDAIIVPHNDEFLNEYIASYAERLKWLTNFSGSAGKAIIMQNTAIIFVDGRYTVQVKKEVNLKKFKVENLFKFFNWLKKNIKKNSIVSLDPKLFSIYDFQLISKNLRAKSVKINLLSINPIDLLWKNQPRKPCSKAFILKIKYSGKSTQNKISYIKSILRFNKIDNYILTSPDSIAWLLNMRGNDIVNTPFNLVYLIISLNKKVELFINLKKINNIQNKISKFVNSNSLESINNFLSNLDKTKIVSFDIKRTPIIFQKICQENNLQIKYFDDPIIYPKAQKNKIEIIGAQKANLRDGLSLTKFLYWLKKEIVIKNTNEIKAANKLLQLRKKNYLFYSPSFDTISAIDSNAAIPHYRVSKKTNKTFKKNSIYLIDSGAQYLDGTTDITRTVIIGIPTDEQKDRFTRVLKGHIAVATCNFLKNTNGRRIDKLARKSLQDIGLDYEHGTGHGVGSFASVHEDPQRITKFQILNEGVIKKNMILSNEPGYYKKNEYGIRIENLIIAVDYKKNRLSFETISFAPIDVDLINKSMLTEKEIKWLKNYHQKVYNKLSNKLNSKEKKWLKKILYFF